MPNRRSGKKDIRPGPAQLVAHPLEQHKLPAGLAVGLLRSHAVLDQRAAPQIEMKLHLLEQVGVEAVEPEQCNDTTQELPHHYPR